MFLCHYFLRVEDTFFIYHFSDVRKRVIFSFYLFLRGYMLHYHIAVVLKFDSFLKIS